MNVTSMLSNGYLRPARWPMQPEKSAPKPSPEASSLSMREQQVLAQERALKSTSSGAEVSTTYRYTVGPDGRRYITAAEVTITGDEDAVDRVGGGVKRQKGIARDSKTEELTSRSGAAKDERPVSESKAEAKNSVDEVVRELKQIEREVVAHEAAHQAAGGKFAGAVSYTYTQGPDGKSYITGGEVPIHVPASSDPEQTLRDMEQVQRAALAPGSPSGQDQSVAAGAAAAAAQARRQLAAQKADGGKSEGTSNTSANEGAFKNGVASVRAGVRFEQIRRADDGIPIVQAMPQNEEDPLTAYALTSSPRGLWALGRGFELAGFETTGEEREERDDARLSIAA